MGLGEGLLELLPQRVPPPHMTGRAQNREALLPPGRAPPDQGAEAPRGTGQPQIGVSGEARARTPVS